MYIKKPLITQRLKVINYAQGRHKNRVLNVDISMFYSDLVAVW